jgi:hypothetical protein
MTLQMVDSSISKAAPLFTTHERRERANRSQRAQDNMGLGITAAGGGGYAIHRGAKHLGAAGRAFNLSNQSYRSGVAEEAKNKPFSTKFERRPSKKTKPYKSTSTTLERSSRTWGVHNPTAKTNAWSAYHHFAEGARYRKIGQGLRGRGALLAGGGLAAVGGGTALVRHGYRQSNALKEERRVRQSERRAMSKADWQTLENIDRSSSKQRRKQKSAKVAGSAGLAIAAAPLVADLQGTHGAADSFSQARGLGTRVKAASSRYYPGGAGKRAGTMLRAARAFPKGTALVAGGALAAGGGSKFAYHYAREKHFNNEAANRRKANHQDYLRTRRRVNKSLGQSILKPLKAMKPAARELRAAKKTMPATARTVGAPTAGTKTTNTSVNKPMGFMRPGKTTTTNMTWGKGGTSAMDRTTTSGRKNNFLYRPAKHFETTSTVRSGLGAPSTTSTSGTAPGQFTNKGKVAFGAGLGVAGTAGAQQVHQNTAQRRQLTTSAFAKSAPDQADAHVVGTLRRVKKVPRKAG